MIIDFHTHIFPDAIASRTISMMEVKCQGPAYTNGMASGLEASTDEAGITTSVILPVVTKPSQFHSINQFAAKINKQYTCRKLISFGGIHPDCEDYKGCLRQIKELGLKGIKLHPDYQGTFFNDVKYMRIVEYASELDLIIVVHAGFDVGLPDPIHCPPRMSREVIDKVKPKKLVLAHMGGMAQWNQVEECLVGQNVYFDTAYVLPIIRKEQFERIVRGHGVDKILFASDSPWQDQTTSVEIMRKMNFTEVELQCILAENAKELLK